MTALPGDGILAWRHDQFGRPRGGNIIGVAGVISAIAVDLFNPAFDLVHQAFEHLAIRPLHRGDLDTDHILGVALHRQMHLTPGVALAGAVLAHFPLAFAVDFQPRGIHHR